MKGSRSEICTGPSVRGLDPWGMKGRSPGVWRVGAGHRAPYTALKVCVVFHSEKCDADPVRKRNTGH